MSDKDDIPPKDERAPPIDAQDYIGGVKVIDFGDMRVQRGMTRRPRSSCLHNNLRFDQNERRIWCVDCEQNIEAFDAFTQLVQQFHTAWSALERRQTQLVEAEAFAIRSIAGRQIEKAWRRHTTVPACPHCGNGLFPEDFKHGVTTLGIEFARARLGRLKK